MVYCYYSYGRRYCRNSSWSGWGRWVLLGVIIAFAVLVFLLFSCISARRRRKLGHKPFMGTGWAAPGHGPVTYTGAGNNNVANKPYEMQGSPGAGYANQGGYNNNTGNQGYYGGNNNTGGASAEYYGGGQAQAYGSNTVQPGTYQPPQYPPNAQTRGDGVVR